jgi:membrane protease subunit HflK
MVILVVVFFGSGMFIVEEKERAMILHFGEPKGVGKDRLYMPGWHWAWPKPIDEVVKIPMGQIHAVDSTVGWYNVTKEQEVSGNEPAPGPSLNPGIDGYTLTSDGNIIHARATVRYSIKDPVRYTFDFIRTSNFVQNAVNNALLYASTRYDVDRATRLDKTGFRDMVLTKASELANAYQLGVEIDPKYSSVDIRPPRQVKDAFESVLSADVDRQRMINEAEGKANEMLSRAKGEAEAVISGARADATRILTSTESDADSFKSQLPRFQANPKLFLDRRMAEFMQRALTNSDSKFLLSDPSGKSSELRLLLNREPLKPAPVATGQP